MKRKCPAPLPDDVAVKQRGLYMTAHAIWSRPVDVSRLLYCQVHRRPAIECHDEI